MYYGMIALTDRDVKIAAPSDVTSKTKNASIIYESYNPKTKKLGNIIKEKNGKCLACIWRDFACVECDRKFFSVEVGFCLVVKACKHSVTSLKMDEVVVLPTCMGCRTSRIRTMEVPRETYVAWKIATLFPARQKDQHTEDGTLCCRKLIWAEHGGLNSGGTQGSRRDRDRMVVGEDVVFNASWGRKARYFKCGQKEHIWAECGP